MLGIEIHPDNVPINHDRDGYNFRQIYTSHCAKGYYLLYRRVGHGDTSVGNYIQVSVEPLRFELSTSVAGDIVGDHKQAESVVLTIVEDTPKNRSWEILI